MNKEQAMQVIEQVCASFQGNLQAHQNIQAALQVIKKELEAKVGQEKPELKEAK